jgi:hypothetical protein
MKHRITYSTRTHVIEIPLTDLIEHANLKGTELPTRDPYIRWVELPEWCGIQIRWSEELKEEYDEIPND